VQVVWPRIADGTEAGASHDVASRRSESTRNVFWRDGVTTQKHRALTDEWVAILVKPSDDGFACARWAPVQAAWKPTIDAAIERGQNSVGRDHKRLTKRGDHEEGDGGPQPGLGAISKL